MDSDIPYDVRIDRINGVIKEVHVDTLTFNRSIQVINLIIIF
jgi:hypothetical protein